MKHFAALRLGVSFFLAMSTFTWDKWILLAAFLLDFFQKYLGSILIIDHTLQMYRLISPHCLCILP